jgi:Ca2+-binding EF-hand superfamily protein
MSDQVAAELAAPQRLEERVNGILLRIEKELDQAEQSIGSSMHVIDLDNDGLISKDELARAMRFLKKNLDEEDLKALLERWGGRGRGGGASRVL